MAKFRHGDVKPSPELPAWFDPDDRSWHGYKRSWKSDAIWVDLRPESDRLRKMADERFGKAKDSMARGNETHNGQTPQQIAQAVGLCGEAAVALLTGGRILGQGTGGDVATASGHVLEVKTTFKWYPFKKFPPSATINPRYFPKSDLVLCTAEGYPECFERVLVIGWLPKDQLYANRQKAPWGGWTLPWKDGVWKHIAEIMNDELADPLMEIGMPGRRRVDDTGISSYIAYYVSGRIDPNRDDGVRDLPDPAASDRREEGEIKPSSNIIAPPELN